MERGSRLTFKAALFVMLFCIAAAAAVYIFQYKSGMNLSSEATVPGSLRVWYTDEAMKSYIEKTAADYTKETGIKVETHLMDGTGYLEEINRASLDDSGLPDVYLIASENLEKAAMAGLAYEPLDGSGLLNDMDYPESAMNSVSYNGEIMAYPLSFETAFLLYDKTNLEKIAESKRAAGENVSAGDLVPSSIEDIIRLAASTDAPPGMDDFFKWDVSDIFYNYFFTGSYMNVGGAAGDDRDSIDIYNEETIRCMSIYQSLNAFFSIDSKESDYHKVMEDFAQGKTLFTIATTDALAFLEARKAAGVFTHEYGVAALPSIDSEHEAKGLSSTSCVVVNGYSRQREAADRLASLIASDKDGSFYELTGKFSCMEKYSISQDSTGNSEAIIRKAYAESAGLPKIGELTDFWLRLELVYSRVWDGEDPNEALKELSGRVKSAVLGTSVSEDAIATPEIRDISEGLYTD